MDVDKKLWTSKRYDTEESGGSKKNFVNMVNFVSAKYKNIKLTKNKKIRKGAFNVIVNEAKKNLVWVNVSSR